MTDMQPSASAIGYGEYGYRQDEFNRLSADMKADIVRYCYIMAYTMNVALNRALNGWWSNR